MLDDQQITALCGQVLNILVKAFRKIEGAVPCPKLVKAHGDKAFRFEEKTVEQALVQKLARVISGLGAARVLLENGFTQELATLQRTLDEFCQDIIFLSLPLLGEEQSSLHERYLAAFYQEEIDQNGDPLASSQRREMIPRKKIRAAIANSSYAPIDPNRHIEIHRTIDKAYSGFLHGASPQIMDMYGGMPPHFHIEGMLGTPRIATATRDLWNYFHRGLNCTMCVALSLKLYPLANSLMEFRNQFELQSGWAPHDDISG